MKQNIYDNPVFFKGYNDMRNKLLLCFFNRNKVKAERRDIDEYRSIKF